MKQLRNRSIAKNTPKTLWEILEAYEKIILLQALARNGFSRSKTAMSLGISRNTLWCRMKILKIALSELPKAKSGPKKKLLLGTDDGRLALARSGDK